MGLFRLQIRHDLCQIPIVSASSHTTHQQPKSVAPSTITQSKDKTINFNASQDFIEFQALWAYPEESFKLVFHQGVLVCHLLQVFKTPEHQDFISC